MSDFKTRFLHKYFVSAGGQAFPLNIFPDHTIISSSFYDNQIHSYSPSIFEFGLGIGGTSLALIIILVLITNLKFIPTKK